MKRRVYIIKGYSKTLEEQTSDEYYVNAYRKFFHRNVGGAYENDEIKNFDQPTAEYLNEQIRKEELDYGILVYIGHGANQDDNQIFQLNKDEIIKAGQFTLNSPKQVILLESCSIYSKGIFTVDLEDHIPKFENGGVVRKPLKRNIARHVYDSQLARCKDGLMVCYACEKGKKAYNYFFSTVLLNVAMDWYLETNRHCGILPIDELFGRTLFNTMYFSKEKIGIEQRPWHEGSFNFPFVVSRF